MPFLQVKMQLNVGNRHFCPRDKSVDKCKNTLLMLESDVIS